MRLTPPMAACRRDVVMEAFDKLDHNKDGVLRIDDLMGKNRETVIRYTVKITSNLTTERNK